MVRVEMWFVDVAGVDAMLTIGVLLRGLAVLLVILAIIPFSIQVAGANAEHYVDSVVPQLNFVQMWSYVFEVAPPLILAVLAWVAALDLKAVPLDQQERFDWKFGGWLKKLGVFVIVLTVVQYYNWNEFIWLYIKDFGYAKAIWDHVAYVEMLLFGVLCFYASVKISIRKRLEAT